MDGPFEHAKGTLEIHRERARLEDLCADGVLSNLSSRNREGQCGIHSSSSDQGHVAGYCQRSNWSSG